MLQPFPNREDCTNDLLIFVLILIFLLLLLIQVEATKTLYLITDKGCIVNLVLVYFLKHLGSFVYFNKKSFWSYFKGLLAYVFGVSMGSLLIVSIGILVYIINKNS